MDSYFQFTTLGDGKGGDAIRLEGDVLADLMDADGGLLARGLAVIDLRTLEAGTYYFYLRVSTAQGVAVPYTIECDAPIRGQTHETTTIPDAELIHGGDAMT